MGGKEAPWKAFPSTSSVYKWSTIYLPHLHFFSPQSLRANTRQESWQLCQRVLSAVGGKDTFKSPREGGRATRLCVGDGGSRGSRMLRVTFSLAAGSCLNKQNETLCCRLGEEIAEVLQF